MSHHEIAEALFSHRCVEQPVHDEAARRADPYPVFRAPGDTTD